MRRGWKKRGCRVLRAESLGGGEANAKSVRSTKWLLRTGGDIHLLREIEFGG